MRKQKIFYVSGAFLMVVGLISGTRLGALAAEKVQSGAVGVTSFGYRARRALILHDDQSKLCVARDIDVAAFEALKIEHEKMSALLKFKTQSGYQLIGAEVLTRSTDPTRFMLTVNRGSKDNVQVGHAVVALEGVFIGIVESVQDHSSTIRLIADPQSKVAGRMLNTNNIEGVVSGGHGIVVRMELVPRTEKIEHGQQLISSGLDPEVPAGLLIGSVIATEEDSNTLFQRVVVEPPLDYTTLTTIAIIE